jgi:hypothetical protein
MPIVSDDITAARFDDLAERSRRTMESRHRHPLAGSQVGLLSYGGTLADHGWVAGAQGRVALRPCPVSVRPPAPTLIRSIISAGSNCVIIPRICNISMPDSPSVQALMQI